MARIFGRRSMTIKPILFFYLFIFLFSSISKAQLVKTKSNGWDNNPADRTIFEEGEYWFDFANYKAALAEYNKLIEKYPDVEVLNYRIGVCELFFSERWERSLMHLKKLPYEQYKTTEYLYFLGTSYHHNLLFDEAIAELTAFLKLKGVSKELKEKATQLLKNCENGKTLKSNPVNATITNLGQPLNTPFSEYVPLVSADGSLLVFTYRGDRSIGGKQFVKGKKNAKEGEYFEDIMMSEKDSLGNWKTPVLFNTNINTIGNDACVSMGTDAQSLIIFRSVLGDNGTLLESTLSDSAWETPIQIPGAINSPSWEGSMTISPDGKTAYFSSERPGGKGGRDIYRATKMLDGSWGKIVNAGDSINTTFDDDAPFYHQSGQYLIICSKGHNSMGGYDIFRCDKINDSTWSKPKNIGYPINTPGDDIYYCLSPDGKKGYYSSGKAGGFGEQDLYVIEPGMPNVDIKFILLSGTVTLDDKPLHADIKIHYNDTDVEYSEVKTNKFGKYITQLTDGNEFKVKVTIPDFEPQTRTLSSKDVNEFLETTIDFVFYSEPYLAKLKKQKDSLDSLANLTKPLIANDPKLIEKYGDSSAVGLTFKVQIGAFNLPQNFNYTKISKLGKVEKLKLNDGVTRFAMGSFKTYSEAQSFKDKIVAAGITDAFVTAIYKGNRTYITELVQMGVFK